MRNDAFADSPVSLTPRTVPLLPSGALPPYTRA